MEGRYGTWGKEEVHPEITRIREFASSTLELIRHNPIEEARLLKLREEKVNKTIREISNFWIKVMIFKIVLFGIITVYIANM